DLRQITTRFPLNVHGGDEELHIHQFNTVGHMVQGFRHEDAHGNFVEPPLEFTRDGILHFATDHRHADEQPMSGTQSPSNKLKSIRKLSMYFTKPTPLPIIEMPPGHGHSSSGATQHDERLPKNHSISQ